MGLTTAAKGGGGSWVGLTTATFKKIKLVSMIFEMVFTFPSMSVVSAQYFPEDQLCASSAATHLLKIPLLNFLCSTSVYTMEEIA